jgi:purine-nucleoside phosphorylase
MIFTAGRQRVAAATPETPPRKSTMRAGSAEAMRRVVASGGRPGRVGAILGTGLGGLADGLDDRWAVAAVDTGWLPKSSATGHAGRIVGGRLAGADVVVLQGRVHGYEGFPAETLARGVELLAALGVTTLLVTNASGGLRPDMRSGELVVMTDHIDLVRGGWALPTTREATPYDAVLAEAAMTATRHAGVAARPGVYAYVRGPSYETRAEYRMLRRFGADVVGMSTVPEVLSARALGMRVAGVSVVTNVARPDAPSRTDAEEVCAMAGEAADGFWAILRAIANA